MELLENPFFGVLLSIIAFEIGLYIYRKTKIAFFNPLLISIIIVIAVLMKFNIGLETFNKGGSLISFFLGPATVALAVPLYKKLDLLKANIASILAGIGAGCITAILSVWFLLKLMPLDGPLGLSLIPKSVTTPIGVEVSKQLGGIPAVTVVAIVLTGIIGAVAGPFLCKVFKIEDKIAVGIAIGTAAHALGTTKAVEMGETEGAMSGLAIGVAGLFTVLLAPLFLHILK